MPTSADFEEKEYEIPLDRELTEGVSSIWSPGQVLEGGIGFDVAIAVESSFFWTWVGFPSPISGVILNDFRWGSVWRSLRIKKRPLPAFRVNLLLQIKRPQLLHRRNVRLTNNNIGFPYWRFEIREHQQRILERVANKLGNRALVAYACPAFHQVDVLYRHIENLTLISNSTFVRAVRLSNHNHWAYDKPGTEGYALSTPEWISEPSFLKQIDLLIEENKPHSESFITDPIKNLENFSLLLREAVKEETEKTKDNSKAKLFIELCSRIQERTFGEDEGLRSARAYSIIRVFCWLFNVSWYVLD